MKSHIKLINLLIYMCVILLVIGCGKQTEKPNLTIPKNTVDNVFPMTLTDQMGREVVIEKIPERIVSLAPNNTEILFALNLEDKIVGVTTFCDYPLGVENKEKIGDYEEPNIEKILSLNPDLVFANDIHQKSIEELEKLNIVSVVLDSKNINEVFDSIELAGKATGQDDEALALTNDLKERMKKIEDKTANLKADERPKVYYELWPSPIMTCGPGTFVNDIILKAGGQNIAFDAKLAYPQYSQEVILAKNPDIIIFSHHGSGSYNITGDEILSRQGWSNVNAVKNKKVYYIDENIVQRATPRLIDGLEQFFKIIHPEFFE